MNRDRADALFTAIMDHLRDGGVNWSTLLDGNAYHWSDKTGRVTLVGPKGQVVWGVGYCDPGNHHQLIGDWITAFDFVEDAIEAAEILAERNA